MIIEIPDVTFSFAEIAKDKANKIYHDHFDNSYFLDYQFTPNLDFNTNLRKRLKNTFNDLITKQDKLVYLCEILNLLTNGLLEAKATVSDNDYQILNFEINKVRYFFYSQAKIIGYDFDKNAFTEEEVKVSNKKVDRILKEIEIIKIGQKVIYNNIDEVKAEFLSLKSDYPLGHKRWYQRIGGIVLSFAGEKGGDELWEFLKPYIADLLKNSPHYIDQITKLLK